MSDVAIWLEMLSDMMTPWLISTFLPYGGRSESIGDFTRHDFHVTSMVNESKNSGINNVDVVYACFVSAH